MNEARRRWALPWPGAVLALVLIGLVGTLVGSSAIPLVLVVLGVTTAVHAPRAGWRASFFLTLLAACVLQVSLAWFTPHVGWSMSTDDTIVWTLAGLAAVPFAVRTPRPRLSRPQVLDAVAVLLVPVAVLGYLLWTSATRHYDWLGWAMGGDSANNMLLVRAMVDEGGLLRSQGNAAPFSTVVFAAWAATGLDAEDQAAAVRHFVLNGGQLTLLFGVLLSVLASILALRTAGRATAGRIAVSVGAGLLPWLWCVMGYTVRQGFQNATPAMVVLLLGWSCWVIHRTHPVASLTGLILTTWAAATAWGPVIMIPAAWMLAVLVVEHKALRRAGRTLLLPLAAFVGAGTYAILVTLRDLTSSGGVPGVDGAHPNHDPWWSLWIGVGLLVLSVVCYRWLPRETTWGYWIAVPGIGLGVLQLIRAREAAELPAWGYYPIKFTWIVMSVGILVLFSVIQPALGRLAQRVWHGNGVVLACVACAALMFQATPPLRPATLGTVLTPVWLHDDTANDRAYERMFELMEDEPRTIVSGYWRQPEGANFDVIINFWLLQSGAENIGDPLRNWAYFMNPADPVALCAAITEWGGDVRVVTRKPKVQRMLDKTCPDAGYDIRMVPR